jgi:general secretion pathway protein D
MGLMNPGLRDWLLRGVFIVSCGLFSTLTLAAEEEITLNFVGADIESAIKAIGQVTKRNFVIDPRVKGTINIVSGKPVSLDLAYQVLVSALRLQGFAVVEGRAATKILPDTDARTQGGPLVGKGKAVGDQIMTQVFHIRYESAVQMVGVLKPLVGVNHSISANAVSNTLVVTDAADNLRRLERIIASIDVPHGDDPQIIPLKYASAVEVAGNLNRLFAPVGGNFGAAAGALVAMADPRANRVLLRADNPGLLARASTLIAGMDKPESGLGNIRVVYLKHADAPRLAQMLRAILGNDAGGAGGNAGGNAASAALAPSAGGFAPTQSSTAQPQAGSFTGAAPPLLGSAGQTNNAALLPGSMIQADVGSNALIITAPETVFNNLQNVIAMLDRRRAQVHIEALIVELTAERAAEFGIQWQDLSGINGSGAKAIGGTNFGGVGTNILSTAINIGTAGRGLNFGIVDGQINIPGIGTITNLGLLARFLETEANANILSTPSIMTLDNEEAKIVIGQNLPFVTGSYSTTGNAASVTPFQTYERRDVGLTLKVRPQITEGGVVRVQIYQEASTVQPGTASSVAGPTTNKRSLESSVLVDDGNVIVLGGLIEDSFGNNEEKVPLLGDIPFLRNLFRYENRNRKKTNLMVFLRPRIIRDVVGYQEITEDRYQHLLVGQKKQIQQTPPAWGDNSGPLLKESFLPPLAAPWTTAPAAPKVPEEARP